MSRRGEGNNTELPRRTLGSLTSPLHEGSALLKPQIQPMQGSVHYRAP